MREIGAAPERLALRRAEHGERPAALLAHDLQRLHVDRVDIGPLLAVDLDVDEQRVHHRRDLGRFEALVRHDVAPVAGGVADREQDRPVGALAPRPAPPRPTATNAPGCWRAAAGRGWSRCRDGSCRLLSPRLPSLLISRTRLRLSRSSALKAASSVQTRIEAGQPGAARRTRRDRRIAVERMGEQLCAPASPRPRSMVMNQSVARPTTGQVTGEISRQARPPMTVSALPLASVGLPARLLWNQQSALSGSTTMKRGARLVARPEIADHRGGQAAHAGLHEDMRRPVPPLARSPPRPARCSRASRVRGTILVALPRGVGDDRPAVLLATGAGTRRRRCRSRRRRGSPRRRGRGSPLPSRPR